MSELSVAEQRYQAVLAVIADGLSVMVVAEKSGVSRQTLLRRPNESDERCRRKCLETLVMNLERIGVDRAVFESRERHQNDRDRHALEYLPGKFPPEPYSGFEVSLLVDHRPGHASGDRLTVTGDADGGRRRRAPCEAAAARRPLRHPLLASRLPRG